MKFSEPRRLLRMIAAGVFCLVLCQWNYVCLAAAEVNHPEPGSSEREQFLTKLVAAAIERTAHQERYDGSYRKIPYPGGDVPDDRGVCTDVIIRAYRKAGVDLQKEVHEDMKVNFSLYPRLWGLTRPDPNIDHRRVANLMVFFKRKGETLPSTRHPADYRPGDLVCWDLGRGITHLGIVVDRKSPDGQRNLIVHNIGAGPRMEDILFDFPIIGHFRYFGIVSSPGTNPPR